MKNIFVTVKKSKIIVVLLCLLVIFSHFLLYFNILEYKNVVDSLSNKIFNGFNKKSSEFEYNENDSNIYFVSNSMEYKILGNKLPVLFLPSNEEYQLENGVFKFKITTNLVVKSAGEGIIKSVGYLDNGLKYVEIRHSGNIITRYENLKIVGVGTNFLVKKIHVIGSSEQNQEVVFKIMKNGKILDNFELVSGEIKWQN